MSYLDWLLQFIFPEIEDARSYQKIISFLFEEEFYWIVEHDENRAYDGIMLRELYSDETGLICEKDGECSVLEMMIALAKSCEEDIMRDPSIGDRTYVWFWEMMHNLGFDTLDDYCYNERAAEKILHRFLSRTYDRDGFGGPFYIPETHEDLRGVELWYQINFYMVAYFD